MAGLRQSVFLKLKTNLLSVFFVLAPALVGKSRSIIDRLFYDCVTDLGEAPLPELGDPLIARLARLT